MSRFLLLVLTCILLLFQPACQKTLFDSTEELELTTGPGYEDDWKKINELEQKQLSKDILNHLDKMFAKAEAEENHIQILKILAHQSKYLAVIKENALDSIFNKYEDKAKTATFPLKQILHSALAEMYYWYYQQNSWRYSHRTETMDFELENIKTWDLNTIMGKVIEHYDSSLSQATKLQKVDISYAEGILVNPKNRFSEYEKELRPTLYDLLAHRALDFYKSGEVDILSPKPMMEINRNYYTTYQNFISLPIEEVKTISSKNKTLELYQQLLKFHQEYSNQNALVHLDLQRLEYLKNSFQLEKEDSLFLSALNKLKKENKKNHAVAEVNHSIAQYYFQKSIEGKKISKNAEARKKAYEIAKENIEDFPGSFGAMQSKALLKQIESQHLGFRMLNAYPIDEWSLISIQHKNIPTAYLKIIKSPLEGLKYHEMELEDKLKLFQKQASVFMDTLSLSQNPDFMEHSSDYAIPPLKKGHYVLIMSDNPEFNFDSNKFSFENFWISNLSFISRSYNNKLELRTLDRNSGVPLRNLKVEAWKRTYSPSKREYVFTKKEEKFTDYDGYVEFSSEGNLENFQFLLTNGKDSLLSDEMFRVFSRNQEDKSKKTAHFFLDRSIYRPGQTVYFKAIIIEEKADDKKVASGMETTVKLYDANGKEINSLDLKTNEYGSVEGFFMLPSSVLTGNFRIRNAFGNQFFSVEEYKRPTFEVVLDSISQAYKLNENISIKGNAKSYTGAAISGAEINYQVIRNYFFPYPFYERSFMPPGNAEIIANGKSTADSEGQFNFTFRAVADPKLGQELKPVYTYSIVVDATAENGETQSKEMEIRIGSQAFLLSSTIPDKVEKDSLKEVQIKAENLSGKPISTEVEVLIQKLIAPNKIFLPKKFDIDKHLIDSLEFIHKFPHLPYGNEDEINNWVKGKILLQKIFQANENFSLPEMQAGAYYLKASSVDQTGDSIKFEKYFTTFSAENDSLPYPETISFFPLQETAEVGETAKFVVGSSFDKLTAFWELEVDGEIVEKKKISLQSEQKLLEIPVKENYRGGFTVHLSMVKNNHSFGFSESIQVPFSNKKLDIELSTFRTSLKPGAEEEWKIKIKNPSGEDTNAELLVSMYDASLDQFMEHSWDFDIYTRNYPRLSWDVVNSFQKQYSIDFSKKREPYFEPPHHSFPYLNWFGFHIGYSRFYATPQLASQETIFEKSDALAEARSDDVPAATVIRENPKAVDQNKVKSKLIPIRSDFRETAFFYPKITANDSGFYTFNFSMPDVLTEWKFNAFAHTKDLKYGQISKSIVSKKELMLFPNMPRFFRQGDSLNISTRIMNMSDEALSGEVKIQFFDAFSDEKINFLLSNDSSKNFNLPKDASATIEWKIAVPNNVELVKYRIIAKTENFSDGEEKLIPVLSNKLLLTESLPMTVRGSSTEYFQLENLFKSKDSKTIENHSLTLEFSSNPVWDVVQALPYLMETEMENSEKVFSRFFANTLSNHIVNSNPKIKDAFDYWRENQPDALLSNLEKNEELKSILLEQTPWLMDAKDETERKRRLAILFDANRIEMEKETAIQKLQQMQLSNGGWPWFANGRDDRYMTQYILAGFGHLKKLGLLKTDAEIDQMLKDAVQYLDARILENFQQKKDSNKHISSLQIHYLYTRSFFPEVKMEKKVNEAHAYYLSLIDSNWHEKPLYTKALAAIVSHRNDKTELAKTILESLRQNSILDENQGMYWKNNKNGFYWYQSSIETQALLIEAFNEIESDTESIEEMKIWLLKQKQSNNWGNSKATALACYTILSTETALDFAQLNKLQIEVGNKEIDLEKNKKEAASGYIKKTWHVGEIEPKMGNVKVEKNSDGVAWGALYWQYFEDIDKIDQSGSILNLHKKLFIEKVSEGGKVLLPINESNKVDVGDKIVVRIVLNVDQRMEYVHMKDLRAAGLEPIETISSYQSQDGLYYYQSSKDASTDFFFGNLPKGSYVFEYALRASIEGEFSNGITSIQCMYAPEFSSHSKAGEIQIVKGK